MAKQRYIKDSFWTDPYIEKLSPDHKLVFLYLLTNPQANIAGVYEIRLKRMAYETGFDIEVVENIIRKFTDDKKLVVIGDWIIITNHLKHQYLGSKTAEGVNRIILESPKEVQELFEEKIESNEKGEEYMIYSFIENIPHTYPIQGVYKVPLSKVKLSKVDLSIKYGEFENVLLTTEEYDKLLDKLGEDNTKLLIEELSTGIASKGYKYKSHYATLLNWARRKITDHKSKVDITKKYQAQEV